MMDYREVCKKNSKSFYFASLLLPKEVRSSVYVFYAFARIADDMIDEYIGEEQMRNISELEKVIDYIFNDENLINQNQVFVDFKTLCIQKNVPRWAVELLLHGFKRDGLLNSVDTEEELLEYCLSVGSSIGLVLLPIFGYTDFETKNKKLVNGAISLGIAFQLTNIARDIQTDRIIGRSYVPLSWGLIDDKYKSNKLVLMAENYYKIAYNSLDELGTKIRFGILISLFIYREIGMQILRKEYYTEREQVSFVKKIWILLCIVFGYVPSIMNSDIVYPNMILNSYLKKKANANSSNS